MKIEEYEKKISQINDLDKIKTIWEKETMNIPSNLWPLIFQKWRNLSNTKDECFEVWKISREYFRKEGIKSFKKYLSFLNKEEIKDINKYSLKNSEIDFIKKYSQ